MSEILPFTGNKKKKTSGASSKPDTYFSQDSFELVLGISEGAIEGLKDSSAMYFFAGDTPLLNIDGASNFEDFELTVNKGSTFGELIVPRLGGTSSTIEVSTTLSKSVPVVRQTTKRNVDWLEIRWAINSLAKEDSKDGPVKTTLQIKVEIKPSNSGNYQPAVFYKDPGLDVQNNEAQTVISQTNKIDGATVARRQVIRRQQAEPVPTQAELELGTLFGNRLIWLPSSLASIKVYRAGAWYTPEQVTIQDKVISWTDINYFRELDPARSDLRRRLFADDTKTPVGPRLGDLWKNFWFNGAAWVSILRPDGEYDPMRGEIPIYRDGIVEINEKISSTAIKELRIKVDRAEDTYLIRMTKLTDDSDNGKYHSDVLWESISEINSDPLIFPNLATVHLTGRASDQFSSIPDFWGIYRGRRVRVPSNYDPVARTYSGSWNGTWKIAWTNNPAFVGYDLVMNDRYGINSTYPVELDPMDVYEAGAWCDVRVGVNKRPQFTYNGLIAEPRSGRETAAYLFGIFGGRYFDDGNGYARLKLDRDQNAVHLFTKENVEGGLFTYGYTAVETRKNDLTVAFINPDLQWKEDRRRVFDQTMIDTYGRVPEDFIAAGCTNEEEAIARARMKMITDATEDETVTFKTNRAGLYLEPYDVVLVADDAMDEIQTGRITGFGSNYVTLRDPVYLERGFTHKLVMTGIGAEGFTVATLTVAASSVGVSTTRLNLTENVPANTPTQTNFSIDSGISARPYRLLTIEEDNDNPDKVTISAQFVNRNKWTLINSGTGAVTIEVPKFDTALTPVTNLRIKPRTELFQDRAIQTLGVTWDAHPNKFVRRYELYWQFNDGSWNYVGETADNFFDLQDVRSGRYVFSVRAISFTGQKSIEALADIDLRGIVRSVPAPTNLQLKNRTSIVDGVSQFDGTAAQFTWEMASLDAMIAGYDLELYDDTGKLIRNQPVAETVFDYDMPSVIADKMTRKFKLSVKARDIYGNQSDAVEIVAFNPAPPVLTPTVHLSSGSCGLDWGIPSPDYVGTLIWVSENGSIDVTKEPTYDILDTHATVYFGTKRKLYAVVAAYDLFGKTGLNYSSTFPLDNLDGFVDFDPPTTPVWETPAFATELDANGQARVVFRWKPNSEDDLNGYMVEARVVLVEDLKFSNWVAQPAFDPQTEFLVPPGITIQARVRAYDRTGNFSAYSDIITAKSAIQTVPPAKLEGLKAFGLFRSASIVWIESTNAFLDRYEVEATYTNGNKELFKAYANRLYHDNLTPGDVITYRVRAVDSSGNLGPWSDPDDATIGALDRTDLPPDAIVSALALIDEAFIESAWIKEIDGNIIRAGSTISNSVIVDGRTIGSIANTDYLFDNFGTDWRRVSGSLPVYDTTSSVTGARAMSLPQGARNILSSPALCAFDPAKTYKITFKVKKSALNTAAPGTIFMGVIGVGADKVSLVNANGQNSATSPFYCVRNSLSQATLTDAYVEYIGYVKGTSDTPGNAQGSADNPAPVHSLTRYLRPWFETNVGSSGAADFGAAVQLDSVKIETYSDVASLINAAKTMIDPGRIRLSGTTALTSILHPKDMTTIDGGKIFAGSIFGSALSIANRSVVFEDLVFQVNKPYPDHIQWVKGCTITYLGDDGSIKSVTIPAAVEGQGNFTFWANDASTNPGGKPRYIFWKMGDAALSTTYDMATAYATSNVVVGIYKGGVALDQPYGQTRVTGGMIETGSIKAAQADIPSFKTEILKARSITTDMLDSGSVDARVLRIGQSNITVQGITFDRGRLQNGTPDSTNCAYTGGSITYADYDEVNKRSVNLTVQIPGGLVWNGGGSGIKYIYWKKGDTKLSNSTDYGTATASDCVLMAIYGGGEKLSVVWGDTTISNGLIQTRAVKAENCEFTNLSGLNLKVVNGDFENLTIGGEKIQNGALSDVTMDTASGTFARSSNHIIVRRNGFSLAAAQRAIIMGQLVGRINTNFETEQMWGGYLDILVGGTQLARTYFVGTSVEQKAFFNIPINAAYVAGDSGLSGTVQLYLYLGSGGIWSEGSYNNGRFTSDLTVDMASLVILKAKK